MCDFLSSWDNWDYSLITAEALLIIIGIFFIFKKSNMLKSIKAPIFIGLVFLLNTAIHICATAHINEKISILCIFDSITCAVKAFVCDIQTESVKDYVSADMLHKIIYGIGIGMAIVTTSITAIALFGSRIENAFRITFTVWGSRDIVVGNSELALSYAKKHKKTIILLPENADPNLMSNLIADKYMVIKRKLTKQFLESRFFNSKTDYNIIFPLENDGDIADVSVITSYFDTAKKQKNFHFYIETSEGALPIAKKRIDTLEKKYCDKISFFSRNELLARKFVSENPMTKYMPNDFLSEDTSLKNNVSLNLYALGFGKLSREIYKQFVINNQFAVNNNGTYEAYPLNCFIYDKNVDEKAWEINGISDTLKELSQNSEEYFPIPDIPCRTKCINESCYEFDLIKAIAKSINKENSFSYILIDSGDVYKNIEIADRFELLLNDCDKFRIFIYDTSGFTTYDNVICYGNTENLYTHETIVNESLSGLARSINTFYNNGTDNWSEQSYFNMSSNISLASNLGFKLNLLGLEYIKDENTSGEELIKKELSCFYGEFSYEDYLKPGKRAAMLAEEHFRWNAFHLMSGYLPMKKSKVKLEKNNDGTFKKVVKNNTLKKHACITTYTGVNELTKHLVNMANSQFGDKDYTSSDFDYYTNDDLLLQAMPGFFKEIKYSVKKK